MKWRLVRVSSLRPIQSTGTRPWLYGWWNYFVSVLVPERATFYSSIKKQPTELKWNVNSCKTSAATLTPFKNRLRGGLASFECVQLRTGFLQLQRGEIWWSLGQRCCLWPNRSTFLYLGSSRLEPFSVNSATCLLTPTFLFWRYSDAAGGVCSW